MHLYCQQFFIFYFVCVCVFCFSSASFIIKIPSNLNFWKARKSYVDVEWKQTIMECKTVLPKYYMNSCRDALYSLLKKNLSMSSELNWKHIVDTVTHSNCLGGYVMWNFVSHRAGRASFSATFFLSLAPIALLSQSLTFLPFEVSSDFIICVY